MKLSTSGRSGKMAKSIKVETDDPVQPTASLEVACNVVVDYDFEKPYLYMRNLRQGETKEEIVKIMAKKPDLIEFGKPQSDSDALAATVVTRKAGKDTVHELKVVFTPKEVGRARHTVTLPIEKPEKKELRLTVTAEVLGDIVAEPNRLSLWSGHPKGKVHTIKVESRKATFKILSAKDAEGKMDVTVKAVKPGKTYELSVSLTDAAEKEGKSFSSRIIVKTDNKNQKELEIPVYFSFRNAVNPSKGSKPVKSGIRMQGKRPKPTLNRNELIQRKPGPKPAAK